MAATNANDSRIKDYQGKEAKSNKNSNLIMNRENRRETSQQGYAKTNTSYRDNKTSGKANENKRNNQDNQSNYRNAKPFNTNKDNKDSRYAGGNSKFKGSKDTNYYKDKDSDTDYKYGKGYGSGKDQRMGDSKLKSGPNKEKDQQPDKLETIKRLEKEKKAILKKSQEFERKEKSTKPLIKHKRTSTIDWTKGYENGLYGDDDEDYTEYL